MDKCYRFWHIMLAALVRFFMHIKVINPEAEPTEQNFGFMICSNHIGAADPVIICAAMRRRQPHFMAKAELFKVPVIRKIIKAWGAYPINRKGGDVGAIKRTMSLIEEGKCVGMFPQGTRHRGEDPRKTVVKQGVGMICAKTNSPVVPIYIRIKHNKYAIFRKVEVIFGEMLSPEDYGIQADNPGEYSRISKYIFGKICDLADTAKTVRRSGR